MMMNNYIDQSEPYSRRLRRNGGKLPVKELPSGATVIEDNLSTNGNLKAASVGSSRPASVGRRSELVVNMGYKLGCGASERSVGSVTVSSNIPAAAVHGGLQDSVGSASIVNSEVKISPSVAGHSSSKFDNNSRTTTSSSNKSGIAPFPKAQASYAGIRKHSAEKFKSDPISDIARNFFRTNRKLKDFLALHNASYLLPEGMVIVEKHHVSAELKNHIFEMVSPSVTPPIDLVAEDATFKNIAKSTQMTVDTDFLYCGHNQVGQLEQPSAVSGVPLLTMDDKMVSSFGQQFLVEADSNKEVSQYKDLHKLAALNVQAPVFTPRTVQARRYNSSNGGLYHPAELVRSATDPDKIWV